MRLTDEAQKGLSIARTDLRLIAGNGCSVYVEGDCATYGRVRDSADPHLKWCDACLARSALTHLDQAILAILF